MKILVVGTGYVGLVTGTCLAEMGHHVICLDVNKAKIDQLKTGVIPIYEPGLEEIVKRNSKAKRLQFSTDYASSVKQSLVCIICVETPCMPDGSCNLGYMESAGRMIAEQMDGYRLIVNKSTVPIGTAHHLRDTIQSTLDSRHIKVEFDVVSNPEFLKEGDAVNDCMKPDRIVIGADSERAIELMKEVYSAFAVRQDKFIVMDILSAELTKYAANAMLATRISFMNELGRLCEATGANINAIRKGIGSDSRIGSSFLYAGAGYGGSCFPKDLKALYNLAHRLGLDLSIIGAVESVNQKQKTLLGEKIFSYFQTRGGIKGKTVALWGLAFKPDTDDMREAASLTLIRQLHNWGAQIRVFDPVAMANAKALLHEHTEIHWCEDELQAAQGADAIALVTEWKQFRLINFEDVRNRMRGRAFFDGRNQYKSKEMRQRGFDYYGIGLPQHGDNRPLHPSSSQLTGVCR